MEGLWRKAERVEDRGRAHQEETGGARGLGWRRQWQPTPVLSPGESQGRGSLVGCRLWGCTESDTTEVT